MDFGVVLDFWCFMTKLLACGHNKSSPVHLIPEITQAVDQRPMGSWPAYLMEKTR